MGILHIRKLSILLHRIQKVILRSLNGDKIQYRYNADNGKVYGVNIEGKLAFGQLAQLQAGFTAQKSLYNEDIEVFSSEDGKTVIKDNRMLRTPDTYGYFIGTVTPVRHFNVSLSGNYTGSLLAPHLQGSGAKNPSIVKTPSFFTLSTKLAYDFELNDLVKIEVNGGIQNMTNAYIGHRTKRIKRVVDKSGLLLYVSKSYAYR